MGLNFLAKKLAGARRDAGLKAQDMAGAAEISRGYYSEIENGKKIPGDALVKKFAKLLSKDPSYFFEPPAVIGETASPYRFTPRNVHDEPLSLRWVPVISWTHAGEATEYEEMPAHWQSEAAPTTCRDPNAFGLIVDGDSMEPHCKAGDRVVVMPNEAPREGCLVVAKLKKNGIVLRRYSRLPNGRIRLIALNQIYPAVDYTTADFHWIYPVESTIRKEWT